MFFSVLSKIYDTVNIIYVIICKWAHNLDKSNVSICWQLSSSCRVTCTKHIRGFQGNVLTLSISVITFCAFTNNKCSSSVSFALLCFHIIYVTTCIHSFLSFCERLPTPKVISLCHQYWARPACTSVQADQALYCWLNNFKFWSWYP